MRAQVPLLLELPRVQVCVPLDCVPAVCACTVCALCVRLH